MTLSAAQMQESQRVMEFALRGAEAALMNAGLMVEGGLLVMVVVPKDGTQFSTLHWHLWHEGAGEVVDMATREILTVMPTAVLDARRRGVSWLPPVSVTPEPIPPPIEPPKRLPWWLAWRR